jgi:hypothetical protein
METIDKNLLDDAVLILSEVEQLCTPLKKDAYSLCMCETTIHKVVGRISGLNFKSIEGDEHGFSTLKVTKCTSCQMMRITPVEELEEAAKAGGWLISKFVYNIGLTVLDLPPAKPPARIRRWCWKHIWGKLLPGVTT